MAFLVPALLLGIAFVILMYCKAFISGTTSATPFFARRWGVAAAIMTGVALMGSPVLAWKFYMHRHALAHLPEALAVDTVEFRAEERWGLPFGDVDEIGLLLYRLPPEQAAQIAREGVQYLEHLPRHPRSDNGLRGLFSDWKETPIAPLFPISSHLCDFDDCPAVPAHVRDRVNRVVSQPGSYYARGRHGTIIVSPGHRLVIFYYSG